MSQNYPSSRNYALALFGLSYSSTNPNLANTDEGQNLLNHKYMLATNDEKNVLRWFSKEDGYSRIRINSLIPYIVQYIFNPIFIDFVKDAIESNISNPCRRHSKTRYLDKLCQALMENDLTNIIEHTTYPIQFCHSHNDTVASIENIPSFGNNIYLSIYNDIPVTDMHSLSESKCLWGALSPFIDEFDDEIPPSNNEVCMEQVSTLELLAEPKSVFMVIFGILTIGFVFFFTRPFVRKDILHYEVVDHSESEEIELGRDY